MQPNKAIQLLIAFFFSVVLPSFPEVALGLVIFAGIFFLLQKYLTPLLISRDFLWQKSKLYFLVRLFYFLFGRENIQFSILNRYSIILLLTFLILKSINIFLDPKNVVSDILEFVGTVFIYFGFCFLIIKIKKQSYLMSLSLVLVIIVAFYQIWSAPKILTNDWILNAEGILARVERIQDFQRFTPINPRTAYIVKTLEYQGSGEIEYHLELRSSKMFEINFVLIHPSIPGGRFDKHCLIKLEWSTCSIHAKLRNRQLTVVGLGGFDTWKGGDAAIEVRNEGLEVIVPPGIDERLASLPRISGWSFNPNAFGALIAVVFCLVVVSFKNPWWIFLFSPFVIVGLILTGSRNAMIASFCGYIILQIGRSIYFKILPWAVIAIVIGILTFQASILSGFIEPNPAPLSPELRSLSIVDKDSSRTRLEIWRLATKAWLNNPQTFLFGTGNLTAAMNLQLDARATGFGLSKDVITHAHNLWLQTAGERGLLGLLTMLWLWIWVIWHAWKARDAAALAILATIFVLNTVDYLFYYAPVQLCFWIAAVGLKTQAFSESRR